MREYTVYCKTQCCAGYTFLRLSAVQDTFLKVSCKYKIKVLYKSNLKIQDKDTILYFQDKDTIFKIVFFHCHFHCVALSTFYEKMGNCFGTGSISAFFTVFSASSLKNECSQSGQT